MKKLLAIFGVLIFATSGFSDKPSVHGMLLFGKNANYVSHLPMFHTPHDYQLIATVELLEKGSGKIIEKYESAKNATTIFTIVPKPMDLSKVLSGEITSFEVIIYKGHFERGGTPIGPAIVKMKNILVGEKIHKEQGASLDFLSFGTSGEYYLAHLITGQPSYDAIYVSTKPMRIIFPRCGRGACPEPITTPVPDSSLPMKLKTGNEQFGTSHPQDMTLSSMNNIHVDITSPFYVEYNELAH